MIRTDKTIIDDKDEMIIDDEDEMMIDKDWNNDEDKMVIRMKRSWEWKEKGAIMKKKKVNENEKKRRIN